MFEQLSQLCMDVPDIVFARYIIIRGDCIVRLELLQMWGWNIWIRASLHYIQALVLSTFMLLLTLVRWPTMPTTCSVALRVDTAAFSCRVDALPNDWDSRNTSFRNHDIRSRSRQCQNNRSTVKPGYNGSFGGPYVFHVNPISIHYNGYRKHVQIWNVSQKIYAYNRTSDNKSIPNTYIQFFLECIVIFFLKSVLL